MNCPICQHPESSVVWTDTGATSNKRRRECGLCHHRWTTFENGEDAKQKLEQIRAALLPVTELVK